MSDPDPVTSLATSQVQIGDFVGYSQTTEYTLSDIATAYQNSLLSIDAILHGTSSTPSAAPTLTTNDATTLSAHLTILRDLLVDGVTIPVDPAAPDGLQKTYYLTTEMADQLTILLRALQILGVTIPNSSSTPISITLAQAQALQEVDSASLILNPLFSFAATSENTKSIQSLVEMDYVRTANDILSEQLVALEQALSATKTTLDYLGNLQEIHNQIVINHSTSFASKFNMFASAGSYSSPSAFLSAYNRAASAFFSPPITPSTKIFPSDPAYELITVPSGGAALLNDQTVVSTKFNEIWNDLNRLQFTLGSSGGMIYANKQADGKYTVFNADGTQLATGVTLNISGGQNGKEQYAFINPNTYSQTFQDAYNLQTINHTDGFNVTFDFGNSNVQTMTLMYSYLSTANDPPNNSVSLFTDYGQMRVIGASNLVNISTSYQAITNASAYSSAITYFNNNILTRILGTSGSLVGTARTTALANLGIPAASQYVFASLGPTGTSFNPVVSGVTPGQQYWLGFIEGMYGIDTNPTHTPSAFIKLQKQLISILGQLQTQLTYLSGTTPRINISSSNPLGDEDPNALVGRLRKVVDDLRTALVTPGGQEITSTTGIMSAYAGIRSWLLDNYDKQQTSANLAGAYQQNITFAITAGQSRKDTETQKVQRFLYVFEEYYKSASAVLQQLTQIIERMAQGISR